MNNFCPKCGKRIETTDCVCYCQNDSIYTLPYRQEHLTPELASLLEKHIDKLTSSGNTKKESGQNSDKSGQDVFEEISKLEKKIKELEGTVAKLRRSVMRYHPVD